MKVLLVWASSSFLDLLECTANEIATYWCTPRTSWWVFRRKIRNGIIKAVLLNPHSIILPSDEAKGYEERFEEAELSEPVRYKERSADFVLSNVQA